MIYFPLLKKDDCLTFQHTDELNQILQELEQQHGEIELLGVTPGKEDNFLELFDKYAYLRLEGTSDRYSRYHELDEFIESWTTLDLTSINSTSSYKSSDPCVSQWLRQLLLYKIWTEL